MVDFTQSGDVTAPPAPFRITSSGVITLKRGGGKIALFGSPFFLAGVFMMLGAAGILPPSTDSGESTTPVILAPMGFVFLAIGGLMVFGRQWLILDLARRAVLRQVGMLVPLWTSERSLTEFNALVMAHDAGGSDSAESYPLKLRASVGKDIRIIDPLQFGESLKTAEYLARVLRLPLIDSTTGHETAVNPDRVGESLRDRLHRAPEVAPPPRPAVMRCEVVETAAETRIVIPADGLGSAGYFRVFLPMAVFLLMMLLAMPSVGESANPGMLALFFVLFFGLPTIYASVTFMRAGKRKKTIVTASPSVLSIEEVQGRKTQTTVIQARDVLDVDPSTIEDAIASARGSAHIAGRQLPENERTTATLRKILPNPGIIVKSRAALITLGKGLTTDELQYLAWLLKKALAR